MSSTLPSEEEAPRPSTSRSKASVLVALPVLLMLAATILWSYQVRLTNKAQTTADRQAAADTMLDALVLTILDSANVVLAVASLFEASEEVDRREFRVFTAPFLKRAAELQALGWIPKVAHEDRAQYEQRAQADFPKFQFTERSSAGEIEQRAERDWYYPVFFLEPLQKNEAALGFDLASSPIRARAIAESTESKKLAITGRINLVQDSENQPGFLLFSPVLLNRGAKENVQLQAFVTGVFRLPALVELAIGPPQTRGYFLTIEDLADTAEERVLHEEATACPRTEVMRRELQIAQRRWLLRISQCTPDAGLLSSFAPWVLFLGGGFSFLLGALVFSIVTRTQDIERTVSERTRELRRSNRDLEQFAYVASHDLRSPLRAIDSLSAWIAEDMEPHLTDESRGHISLLQARIQRMEALLDALLEYAMVGRRKFSVTQVDLNELVKELASVAANDTKFLVETGGLLPVISTSRVAIDQVLANLIGNAIKHHHRGEGRVEVSVADEGRFWRFSVADDGPGIEADFRERVFEMFQTLRSRDEIEGSGMGLALVRRRVEGMGGEISCHPGADGGSVFTFTWPKTLPSTLAH